MAMAAERLGNRALQYDARESTLNDLMKNVIIFRLNATRIAAICIAHLFYISQETLSAANRDSRVSAGYTK
jgi:hypothetical protein